MERHKGEKKLLHIMCIIIILFMTCIIIFFQTKKQGYHEDEVYTISTSVNPYDGLVYPYGEKEARTILLEKYVYNKNILKEIKNVIHFFLNQKEYKNEIECIQENQRPVWKTREEINDYMTLKKENYFNFKGIYYNQAKDNHPIIFYILVHISSILFNGEFNKYVTFFVNIIAFIISCFIIINILKKIKREDLTIATLILYGLSMGTISMVIYQRMYMLLTMFILLYFNYNLKIYLNDFNISKKDIFCLGIICLGGFLTQYYYAIFAINIFVLMCIKIIKEKKYKDLKKYILIHIIYAILGIMIFVPAIYHMFFTKRGILNIKETSYIKNVINYLKHLTFIFTIKYQIILLIIILGNIYLMKKTNKKFEILILSVPSITYFLLVAKLTSYQEFRYIMPIIPFLTLNIIFILDSALKTKYREKIIVIIAIILVGNGFTNSYPKFLYEEYKECLKIAEENKEKLFVYVDNNYFNHMQSIPEMMIYKESLIINESENEVNNFINDEKLNAEDSYILEIKNYIDNENILKIIKENTEFKEAKCVFSGSCSTEKVQNNIYIISK